MVGDHVAQLIGFPREAIGEDKKTGNPEANENTEPLSVGAIFFRGGEPCGHGGDDG